MPAEIKLKIQEYIVEKLLGGDPRGLTDETPLAECGLLDSFSLIELIFHLEEEFNIKLGYEQISLETFRTLNAVSEMVQRAIKAGQSNEAPVIQS
jgi:acyl carrier protein